MYLMSTLKAIQATMARISETRNTTPGGAFKVGMLPPVKLHDINARHVVA